MRKEIRTRKVQKSIRTLDKSAVAAEHLKNAYVRTKDSARQTQQGKENDRAESVQYAENRITGTAGLAARQSIRQAGKTPSCLSAGMEKVAQPLDGEIARRQMYRKVQEQARQKSRERTSQKSKESERTSGEQTGWQERAEPLCSTSEKRQYLANPCNPSASLHTQRVHLG